MILILSPAKNMIDAADVPDWNIRPLSRPAFLQEASFLSKELKQFSPWQLETILGVNPCLESIWTVSKVSRRKWKCSCSAFLSGAAIPASFLY